QLPALVIARAACGSVLFADVIVERNRSFFVLFRRTQQPRDEVVGKERGGELIGFLRVLACRAGGQENGSLAGECAFELDVERWRQLSPLDVGEPAGTASVEHQDAKAGRRGAKQLLELPELEAARPQMKRLSVRMSRIIDEQDRSSAAARGCANSIIGRNQSARERVGASIADKDQVLCGKTPQLLEHILQ